MTSGHMGQAAELLGIPRLALWRRLSGYRLSLLDLNRTH
ncbi:MAG: helix-turn-helix domain-containing protein [Gemmatimonadaceae bacterium]